MHLKSSNGPIDVLVCPETEEDYPQSPLPSSSGHFFSDSHQTSTPMRLSTAQVTVHTPETMQRNNISSYGGHVIQHRQTTPTINVSMERGGPLQSQHDLDISLNSAADMTSDLDELMASYNHVPMDSDHFLSADDLIPFESLNPPLHIHDDDFSFALDDATEGIHELFDLVS